MYVYYCMKNNCILMVQNMERTKIKKCFTNELGQFWLSFHLWWKTCKHTKVLFLQHTYISGARQFFLKELLIESSSIRKQSKSSSSSRVFLFVLFTRKPWKNIMAYTNYLKFHANYLHMGIWIYHWRSTASILFQEGLWLKKDWDSVRISHIPHFQRDNLDRYGLTNFLCHSRGCG